MQPKFCVIRITVWKLLRGTKILQTHTCIEAHFIRPVFLQKCRNKTKNVNDKSEVVSTLVCLLILSTFLYSVRVIIHLLYINFSRLACFASLECLIHSNFVTYVQHVFLNKPTQNMTHNIH